MDRLYTSPYSSRLHVCPSPGDGALTQVPSFSLKGFLKFFLTWVSTALLTRLNTQEKHEAPLWCRQRL